MNGDRVESENLKGNEFASQAYFATNKKEMKSKLLNYINTCRIRTLFKTNIVGEKSLF